jgi:hypothetical protein
VWPTPSLPLKHLAEQVLDGHEIAGVRRVNGYNRVDLANHPLESGVLHGIDLTAAAARKHVCGVPFHQR